MIRKVKKCLAMCLSVALLAGMKTPAVTFGANDIYGHWAQSTISKWVSFGYINGYPDGSFRPDAPISRAEFVVLVNKAAHVTEQANISFYDVDSSYWAYNEIQKGVGRGFVSGNGDGTFSPGSMVSRQEAAVMIAKIQDYDTETSPARVYTDFSQMPDWSRPYIGAVTRKQVMRGYPNGSFRPYGSMTRAEAVIALDMLVSSAVAPPDNSNNNNSNDNQKPVNGDMTLGRNEDRLKNKTIKGDLTIPDDMNVKSILLEDVTVEGTLYVQGGGSIELSNCDIKDLVLEKKGVLIKTNSDTVVKDTFFRKNAVLDGRGFTNVTVADSDVDTASINARVKYLSLDTDAKLKLSADARVEELTVSNRAGKTSISLAKGAVVDEMLLKSKVTITGQGKIDKMTVYVSGIKSEIRPDTVATKDGAAKPTYGSSSSDSGGSSSSYDNLVLDDEDQRFDGNDKKYRDVRIEADGVRLRNVIVTGDLTIDRSVGNGTVTLDNVEVRGTTYIYGGGENSVYLLGCKLSGDVVSNVANKKVASGRQTQPVAIKFNSDSSVNGKVRVLGNTLLLAEGTGKIKLPTVVVETALDRELTVGVDVSTLQLNKKTAVGLENNSSVNALQVQNTAGGSQVTFRSKNATVNELVTDAYTEVAGAGKVNTIRANADIKVGADTSVGNIVRPEETVKVDTVTLNQTTASVELGGTVKLTAAISPANAKNKTVVWSTDNDKICQVDQSGLVRAVAPGSAKITVTTQDGAKKAVCTVTVTDSRIPVTGLSINQTKASIVKGGTLQLVAEVMPSNATNKKVQFSSSNSGIARVDQTGRVVGEAVGTATIQVITEDGAKNAACAVTVLDDSIAVTGVSVDPKKAELKEGETVKLSVLLAPSNATNSEVAYTSSNPDIASVGKDGLVTAKSAGSANITVKTVDGGKTAVCEVTVKKAVQVIPVESVSISDTELTLEEGQTRKISAAVVPGNATNPNIRFVAQNPTVLSVDQEGLITAMHPGSSNVLAVSEDGNKRAECAVTVTKKVVNIPVTGVSLNQTEASLLEGADLKLQAEITPEDATNKKVGWYSSNPDVAIVQENGQVWAQKAGTAEISVVTEDGQKKAVCAVTVTAEVQDILVEQIILEPTTLSMQTGGKALLSATASPAEAKDKKLVLSTSNPAVATVEQDGTVTAVAAGKAQICVWNEASGVEAVCTVTVQDPPPPEPETIPVNGVSFSPKTVTVEEGKSVQLSPAVSPSNATNQALHFESDNPEAVTVDADGKVTGLHVSTAAITVTTEDGSFKDTCTVMVTKKTDNTPLETNLAKPDVPEVPDVPSSQTGGGVTPVQKPGFTMSASKVALTAGKSIKLSVNADAKEVLVWSSSNPEALSVAQDGTITAVRALKPGEKALVVTVQSQDLTKTASCAVTIKAPGNTQGILLNFNSATVQKGGTVTLSGTAPDGAPLVFQSSDPNIADVTPAGVVTGVTAGKTISISVSTQDGKYRTSCMITVQ